MVFLGILNFITIVVVGCVIFLRLDYIHIRINDLERVLKTPNKVSSQRQNLLN